MKIIAVFIVYFVLPIILFGQSNYHRGFQDGYRIGYCYEQPLGCLPPPVPNAQLPGLGSSSGSYIDGYNKGFIEGINKSQSNSVRLILNLSQVYRGNK